MRSLVLLLFLIEIAYTSLAATTNPGWVWTYSTTHDANYNSSGKDFLGYNNDKSSTTERAYRDASLISEYRYDNYDGHWDYKSFLEYDEQGLLVSKVCYSYNSALKDLDYDIPDHEQWRWSDVNPHWETYYAYNLDQYGQYVRETEYEVSGDRKKATVNEDGKFSASYEWRFGEENLPYQMIYECTDGDTHERYEFTNLQWVYYDTDLLSFIPLNPDESQHIKSFHLCYKVDGEIVTNRSYEYTYSDHDYTLTTTLASGSIMTMKYYLDGTRIYREIDGVPQYVQFRSSWNGSYLTLIEGQREQYPEMSSYGGYFWTQTYGGLTEVTDRGHKANVYKERYTDFVEWGDKNEYLLTTPLNVLYANGLNYSKAESSRRLFKETFTDWKYIGDYNSACENALIDRAEVPVEYYNLQGIKVPNPTDGQLLIAKHGNQARKIVYFSTGN